MNFFQAIFLGLVQALTEYLPVSSSAHVRIVGDLMLGSDPGAAFTAIIQIGTELAVLLYFRHDIWNILKNWCICLAGKNGKDWKHRLGEGNKDARLGWYIIIATLPIVFAGLLFRRRKAGGKETLYAETKLDADKVCSRLLSMILVMDKCLEDIRNAARQEEKNRLKEQAAAMDPAELELLSRLLEDAYARKGTDEQAEEEIAQIRFYLHRKSVDVVDWTGDKPGQSGWFDMMPAFSGGTLRPALIADGVLLKKGLASAGRG